MRITLEELLLSREKRAHIQGEMIRQNGAPLISFTMNIPGPEKTSPIIERAFDLGVSLILSELDDGALIMHKEERSNAGPVSFFSVKTDAKKLKRALVRIEDTHPIGRLFDMDVIDTDGRHLTRDFERGCMICAAPGRACAAGRLHSVDELVLKTYEILTEYFTRIDAQHIAEIAKNSLISEVYTAPKPGLVDPESRGSHTDMEVSDFERSAEALTPYFVKCVEAGAKSKRDGTAVFPILKELGTGAEAEMYKATGGKNTHKGIIFSLGIILGAVGRLLTDEGALPSIDRILSEAGDISRPFIESDLNTLSVNTAGARAYALLGVRGIRGEAMDGFPSVRKIAIPTYRSALFDGKNKNDAGAFALLHLIANVYDTCIYKRGGEEGVRYAGEYARALLDKCDITVEEIRKMDNAFIEKNLSPGGCADLLALTYFLCDLEEEMSV